MTQAEI